MNENTSGPFMLEELFGAKTVSDKTGEAQIPADQDELKHLIEAERNRILAELFRDVKSTFNALGIYVGHAVIETEVEAPSREVLERLKTMQIVPQVKVSVQKQVDDILSRGNVVFE